MLLSMKYSGKLKDVADISAEGLSNEQSQERVKKKEKRKLDRNQRREIRSLERQFGTQVQLFEVFCTRGKWGEARQVYDNLMTLSSHYRGFEERFDVLRQTLVDSLRKLGKASQGRVADGYKQFLDNVRFGSSDESLSRKQQLVSYDLWQLMVAIDMTQIDPRFLQEELSEFYLGEMEDESGKNFFSGQERLYEYLRAFLDNESILQNYLTQEEISCLQEHRGVLEKQIVKGITENVEASFCLLAALADGKGSIDWRYVVTLGVLVSCSLIGFTIFGLKNYVKDQVRQGNVSHSTAQEVWQFDRIWETGSYVKAMEHGLRIAFSKHGLEFIFGKDPALDSVLEKQWNVGSLEARSQPGKAEVRFYLDSKLPYEERATQLFGGLLESVKNDLAASRDRMVTSLEVDDLEKYLTRIEILIEKQESAAIRVIEGKQDKPLVMLPVVGDSSPEEIVQSLPGYEMLTLVTLVADVNIPDGYLFRLPQGFDNLTRERIEQAWGSTFIVSDESGVMSLRTVEGPEDVEAVLGAEVVASSNLSFPIDPSFGKQEWRDFHRNVLMNNTNMQAAGRVAKGDVVTWRLKESGVVNSDLQIVGQGGELRELPLDGAMALEFIGQREDGTTDILEINANLFVDSVLFSENVGPFLQEQGYVRVAATDFHYAAGAVLRQVLPVENILTHPGVVDFVSSYNATTRSHNPRLSILSNFSSNNGGVAYAVVAQRKIPIEKPGESLIGQEIVEDLDSPVNSLVISGDSAVDVREFKEKLKRFFSQDSSEQENFFWSYFFSCFDEIVLLGPGEEMPHHSWEVGERGDNQRRSLKLNYSEIIDQSNDFILWDFISAIAKAQLFDELNDIDSRVVLTNGDIVNIQVDGGDFFPEMTRDKWERISLKRLDLFGDLGLDELYEFAFRSHLFDFGSPIEGASVLEISDSGASVDGLPDDHRAYENIWFMIMDNVNLEDVVNLPDIIMHGENVPPELLVEENSSDEKVMVSGYYFKKLHPSFGEVWPYLAYAHFAEQHVIWKEQQRIKDTNAPFKSRNTLYQESQEALVLMLLELEEILRNGNNQEAAQVLELYRVGIIDYKPGPDRISFWEESNFPSIDRTDLQQSTKTQVLSDDGVVIDEGQFKRYLSLLLKPNEELTQEDRVEIESFLISHDHKQEMIKKILINKGESGIAGIYDILAREGEGGEWLIFNSPADIDSAEGLAKAFNALNQVMLSDSFRQYVESSFEDLPQEDREIIERQWQIVESWVDPANQKSLIDFILAYLMDPDWQNAESKAQKEFFFRSANRYDKTREYVLVKPLMGIHIFLRRYIDAYVAGIPATDVLPSVKRSISAWGVDYQGERLLGPHLADESFRVGFMVKFNELSDSKPLVLDDQFVDVTSSIEEIDPSVVQQINPRKTTNWLLAVMNAAYERFFQVSQLELPSNIEEILVVGADVENGSRKAMKVVFSDELDYVGSQERLEDSTQLVRITTQADDFPSVFITEEKVASTEGSTGFSTRFLSFGSGLEIRALPPLGVAPPYSWSLLNYFTPQELRVYMESNPEVTLVIVRDENGLYPFAATVVESEESYLDQIGAQLDDPNGFVVDDNGVLWFWGGEVRVQSGHSQDIVELREYNGANTLEYSSLQLSGLGLSVPPVSKSHFPFKSVDLSDNEIGNHDILGGIEVRSLGYLNLSGNSLTRIPGYVRYTSDLELDLSDNKIDYIDDFVVGAANLHINLGGNPITQEGLSPKVKAAVESGNLTIIWE